MWERMEKFSTKMSQRERERVKNSQLECEILINMRFSRMWEILEKFSRRMWGSQECERETEKFSTKMRGSQEWEKDWKSSLTRMWEREWKFLNKNVRFSQMWGSQEC